MYFQLSRKNFLKWFHGNLFINTGIYIRVCISPLLSIRQVIKFSNHQTARKTRFTGIQCIYCRMGASDK